MVQRQERIEWACSGFHHIFSPPSYAIEFGVDNRNSLSLTDLTVIGGPSRRGCEHEVIQSTGGM
ncbi:hypothetical protein CsSME_00014980 [Camellia sinensis var. sinensis]